jgi:RND family efflux transporter MFP subunit
MKKPLNYLGYILLVSTLFVGTSYSESYKITQIVPEPFTHIIERTGKLAFKRTLSLSFKTSGFLDELNVDEGDHFEQGQILAALDKYELIAEKNSTYASLIQAKKDVQRTELLIAKKLSSPQVLENAKTLVETTRARFNIAGYNLDKSQLIAPFNGVVLSRFSELGELQNPNQSVLQLAALKNNLVARVAITSNEMSWVALNQPVDVSIEGVGTVTGIISKIPVIADQQSQLFTIEVSLPDEDINSITVGQFVDVMVSTTSKIYTYRLPIAALNSVDEKGYAIIAIRDENTETSKNKPIYSKKAFKIIKLTNNYIYLNAEPSSQPLSVIINGWQKIADIHAFKSL